MPHPPLLDKTLGHCRRVLQAGGHPVAIFDLDGTVFDNGPRTWQILADFAESTGRGPLRRALNKVPHTGLPYTLRDILALAGEKDDAVVAEGVEFWKRRFFTHEYQRFDVPLPGAVAFVRALYDEGATVCYLTGRDYPGMAVGCVKSLHDYGFPVAMVRTSLVLKPDFETADLAFKTEAIEFIDTFGTVAASFDNEPGNCNLFQRRWPDALVGLCDTTHAPGAPPLDAGIVRFEDFLA